jgi:hypothetical protein
MIFGFEIIDLILLGVAVFCVWKGLTMQIPFRRGKSDD